MPKVLTAEQAQSVLAEHGFVDPVSLFRIGCTAYFNERESRVVLLSPTHPLSVRVASVADDYCHAEGDRYAHFDETMVNVVAPLFPVDTAELRDIIRLTKMYRR